MPVGSALAAGNAVILKPSEYTPGCGAWLADTFTEAVPGPPVLQVATGGGSTGAALCRAGMDKVAFTGSSATGAKVLAECADTLTPVVLELGGKDALIVAEDADVAAAAEATLWGACTNAGQTCIGIERAYVADRVWDRFLDELTTRAASVKGGLHYGPILLPAQLDTIRRHIADALERGAHAVHGGLGSVHPPYVTEPIILTDVPEDAAVVTEETFGPVLVVNRVRDTRHGIELANASAYAYALGGALFARRHWSRARALRAGMISVNDVLSFPAVPALPFGGRARSGFGRTTGADGLREFSTPQAVARRIFPLPFSLQSYSRPVSDTVCHRLLTTILRR
ncbi:aldehyde dehydrogenase family protein [Streptomyces sp. NPDC101150]|uniref:aldehyde dehydrogenase family protein n=1 Tax=Streptomyces sp. NPDC101150 TaxID=3366114 RepID=UPI003803D4C8